MEATANDRKNRRYGIILSYVSMVVSILATLLVTDLILEYIGDYNYGLLSFVNSITSWLTVVSSALTASFVRFSSIEYRDKDGNTARTNTIYLKLLILLSIAILVLGIAVLVPLYFCQIPFASYSWEDSERIYILFALSIINIAISMPTSVWSLYISFKQKFIFQRILTIVTTILTYGAHLLLAFLTREVLTFAICSIAITLVTFLANYFFSRKNLDIEFSKDKLGDNKVLVRSIIAFSGILLFNSIVDQINTSVDKTLLGFMATPEDVTIYQLGGNFSTYLGTMSVAISGVYVPLINEMATNGKDEEINALYLRVSRVQLLVLTIIAFGFLSCGKTFVTMWIGEERINAFYVAAGLMISNICPLSINTSIEIQRARNKHLFRAVTYFVLALTNVGLSIVFLLVFPAEYAIFACLLGTLITRFFSHWIAMNVYNAKEMKLPVGKYLINLIKYIIIGGGAFGLVFSLDYLFIDSITTNILKFLLEGSLFVVFYLILFIVIEHKFFMSLVDRLKQRLNRNKNNL